MQFGPVYRLWNVATPFDRAWFLLILHSDGWSLLMGEALLEGSDESILLVPYIQITGTGNWEISVLILDSPLTVIGKPLILHVFNIFIWK